MITAATKFKRKMVEILLILGAGAWFTMMLFWWVLAVTWPVFMGGLIMYILCFK